MSERLSGEQPPPTGPLVADQTGLAVGAIYPGKIIGVRTPEIEDPIRPAQPQIRFGYSHQELLAAPEIQGDDGLLINNRGITLVGVLARRFAKLRLDHGMDAAIVGLPQDTRILSELGAMGDEEYFSLRRLTLLQLYRLTTGGELGTVLDFYDSKFQTFIMKASDERFIADTSDGIVDLLIDEGRTSSRAERRVIRDLNSRSQQVAANAVYGRPSSQAADTERPDYAPNISSILSKYNLFDEGRAILTGQIKAMLGVDNQRLYELVSLLASVDSTVPRAEANSYFDRYAVFSTAQVIMIQLIREFGGTTFARLDPQQRKVLVQNWANQVKEEFNTIKNRAEEERGTIPVQDTTEKMKSKKSGRKRR